MEGPSKLVIPEQRYNTCNGCNHYSMNMMVSGMNPKYAYNCNHPDISKEHSCFLFTGNLHKNLANVVETPDWCPYLISRQLTFSEIRKGMRIIDSDGDVGTIETVDDPHNVYVKFDNGGAGLFCLDETCDEYKDHQLYRENKK